MNYFWGGDSVLSVTHCGPCLRVLMNQTSQNKPIVLPHPHHDIWALFFRKYQLDFFHQGLTGGLTIVSEWKKLCLRNSIVRKLKRNANNFDSFSLMPLTVLHDHCLDFLNQGLHLLFPFLAEYSVSNSLILLLPLISWYSENAKKLFCLTSLSIQVSFAP